MNYDRYVLHLFFIISRNEPSKGLRNEKRAVAAFQGTFWDVPEWFLSIRNATPREDNKGIDVMVTTNMGDVKIQIKSCLDKAAIFIQEREHGRYSKDIQVAMFKEDYTPYQVRQVIIETAKLRYDEILAEFATAQGFEYIPAA